MALHTVTGYRVERRDTRGRGWTLCDTTEELTLTVTGLTEGTSYLMHVAAENDVGLGPYTDLSSPAVPKSQFSMYPTC